MESFSPVLRVALYALLLGVPALFVLTSLLVLRRAGRFSRRAQVVAGTVISVAMATSNQRSGSSFVYIPTFGWTGPDGPMQATVRGGSSAYNFAPGTTVEILVNPAFPGVAAIKGEWPYLMGTIFLVVGLIFAAVGVAALLSI